MFGSSYNSGSNVFGNLGLTSCPNTDEIATNTLGMAVNASNINTNTENIITNTSNITTNTSSLNTLTSSLATVNSNLSEINTTNTVNIDTAKRIRYFSRLRYRRNRDCFPKLLPNSMASFLEMDIFS